MVREGHLSGTGAEQADTLVAEPVRNFLLLVTEGPGGRHQEVEETAVPQRAQQVCVPLNLTTAMAWGMISGNRLMNLTAASRPEAS
jgi:hypothetical protein